MSEIWAGCPNLRHATLIICAAYEGIMLHYILAFPSNLIRLMVLFFLFISRGKVPIKTFTESILPDPLSEQFNICQFIFAHFWNYKVFTHFLPTKTTARNIFSSARSQFKKKKVFMIWFWLTQFFNYRVEPKPWLFFNGLMDSADPPLDFFRPFLRQILSNITW